MNSLNLSYKINRITLNSANFNEKDKPFYKNLLAE